MSNDIAKEIARLAEKLGVDRKRSIEEVSQELGIKPHIIQLWEENFSQIKPQYNAEGIGYYYNKQISILRKIKKFLYEDGYTINGLRKLLSNKNREEFLAQNGQEMESFFSEDYEEDSNQSLDSFIDDEHKITINYNAAAKISNHEEEIFEEEEEINFSGVKINRDTKLLNFADINISNIDVKAKEEAVRLLVKVKDNLENLKKILR